ncbi:general stress protein [Pseudobacillus badius]|uniref:general stress protein n=1 Tax=Bacillus badius TaxID=1455 RepID=UPI003CF330AD
MPTKKVIGLCSSEIDAIRRIEELKVEGFAASQLYAITKDADFHLMLQNRSGAKVISAGPSMKDKMKAVFSKEAPVKEYLLEFGLSEEDAEAYYKNVEEDLILLAADDKESTQATEETAAGIANPPLPDREEAERRRLMKEQRTTESAALEESTLPPDQQALYRDYL